MGRGDTRWSEMARIATRPALLPRHQKWRPMPESRRLKIDWGSVFLTIHSWAPTAHTEKNWDVRFRVLYIPPSIINSCNWKKNEGENKKGAKKSASKRFENEQINHMMFRWFVELSWGAAQMRMRGPGRRPHVHLPQRIPQRPNQDDRDLVQGLRSEEISAIEKQRKRKRGEIGKTAKQFFGNRQSAKKIHKQIMKRGIKLFCSECKRVFRN